MVISFIINKNNKDYIMPNIKTVIKKRKFFWEYKQMSQMFLLLPILDIFASFGYRNMNLFPFHWR